MRLRWLVAAVAALALFPLGEWAGALWRDLELRSLLWEAGLADASSDPVYVLDRTRELEFVVPASAGHLRVVANGTLGTSGIETAAGRKADAESEWRYTLGYELLDADAKVVVASRYHHGAQRWARRSGPRGARDGGFYLERRLAPLESRLVPIHLGQSGTRVARLRLRLATADPAVLDVAVRVFSRDARAGRPRMLWTRLSAARRARLARANVYPADLLSAGEKRSLLARPWTPLAPEGIAGSDYERRQLYWTSDSEGGAFRGDEDAGRGVGLRLGAERRAVVPLPEQGGRVRLELEAEPDPAAPAEGALRIRWYGRERDQRSERRQTWRVGSTVFEGSFAGGLLEIEAQGVPRATLRAFLAPGSAGAEREITPEPGAVWAYRLDAGAPVEFDVLHAGAAATPYRLDLRRRLDEPPLTDAPGADVSFELVTDDGVILRRGVLRAPDADPSVYDEVVSGPEREPVSEPAVHYLSLEPGVSVLRLLPTPAPLIVSGYNRPPSLPRRIAVPEDGFAFNRGRVAQRAWFLLEPADAAERHGPGRRLSVAVQARPPEDQPDVLSGLYAWEDFAPSPPGETRELLLGRRSGPVHAEARAATFCEIPSGVDVAVAGPGETPGAGAARALLYLSPSTGPIRLEVSRHGRPWHAAVSHAARGVLALPSLPAGDQHLRFATSRSARLFLNGMESCHEARLLRRLVHRVTAEGLRFEIEKTQPGDELLSVRLHVPMGATSRIELSAEVSAPRPRRDAARRSWTFRRRLYSVRPAGGPAAPLLEAGLRRLDSGQVFAIPLGSDIPVGPVEVRIAALVGEPAYLTLSRTTPGLPESRQIRIERETPGVARSGAGADAANDATQALRTVARLRSLARQGGRFEAPSDDEFQRALALFGKTFTAGADASGLAREWAAAGFELRRVSRSDHDLMILRERPDQKRGRGFYVFRLGPAAPLAIQSPHTASDLGTGPLALRLFARTGGRAAALSTRHRREGDLAHLDGTHYQAFALAFSRALGAGAIVELHGFDAARRAGRPAGSALAIVSSGSEQPAPAARRVHACLEQAFPGRIRLYPRDVEELGGTTNAQARLLREEGFGGFLHLELSGAFRRALREEPEQSGSVASCLVSP